MLTTEETGWGVNKNSVPLCNISVHSSKIRSVFKRERLGDNSSSYITNTHAVGINWVNGSKTLWQTPSLDDIHVPLTSLLTGLRLAQMGVQTPWSPAPIPALFISSFIHTGQFIQQNSLSLLYVAETLLRHWRQRCEHFALTESTGNEP